jgi:hypothetical protein
MKDMALIRVDFSDPFSVLGYACYVIILVVAFVAVVRLIKKNW